MMACDHYPDIRNFVSKRFNVVFRTLESIGCQILRVEYTTVEYFEQRYVIHVTTWAIMEHMTLGRRWEPVLVRTPSQSNGLVLV